MVQSVHLRSIAALLALFALAACGGEAPPVESATATDTDTDTVTQENPTATTEQGKEGGEAPAAEAAPGGGFEPISSRDQRAPSSGTPASPTPAASAGSGGAEIVAAGAVFALPATWRSEPPASSMRLAQASIPGAGGDAQLTVFHFGVGGGGGVENNLQRWAGQVELTPGSTPFRDTFQNAGLTITWIDVMGTLKPSMMGTGPTTPQPDSQLLGAVVEGPGGPWFFKATGPAATLTEARPAFVEMLRGIRVHP